MARVVVYTSSGGKGYSGTESALAGAIGFLASVAIWEVGKYFYHKYKTKKVNKVWTHYKINWQSLEKFCQTM